MSPTRKLVASGLFGIALGFAVLALASYVALRAELQRREAGAWLRHTIQVQNDLYQLYGLLQAAESGQRGFIITQDERYLDACFEATRKLPVVVDRLSERVRDNPKQLEAVAEMRPLLGERVAIIDEAIADMRALRVDNAVRLVKSGRGKALMDRLHAIIDKMTENEQNLFDKRERELNAAGGEFDAAVWAIGGIIFALAAFSFLNAQKQMHALQTSRDSLKTAYDQLIGETTRREALESQLRQSQKLEALGHLTGGIAHDFNNMLGVIVASLHLLRRKLTNANEDCIQLIDSAMDGADRAAAMVRRLLAFSRRQPLSPRPLDPNKFVSSVSDMVRRALGEKIELETVLAGGLWATKIDQHELESAIVNLAVNARDAMPDGGKLTIETANCYLDDAYASENIEVTPGQYVMIAVTDTGQGMPPEVLSQAFDPFFTTKPAGKGTGLGLSQVHGFVKQSGGQVKIYSEPGRGTCIKLYLPRFNNVEAPAELPLRPPRPLELPLGRPEELVLIVEDDDTARRVTAQGVRELGYSVLEAENGRAAIDIIRRRPDIALMVTDVVMPDMDGARLAREAVFRRHSLRVLFITGYTRNAIVHNGVLDKDVKLLTKPFTLEQLAIKMRDILDSK
ncbi:CHASE3 domain-containing protein [Methylocystis sp. L43]|jgi:signal transduction histidine kinase|uniref:CHASE3 domain-containing protein n=1 Tax=unclassified Methylocystis TaxID=2625913 RepID=UPI0018C328E0|nr:MULTISPECIES: CHASE3 domain-containing protein [unclassified Methylocystis]MBG0798264.1 CHASE3 domain-containing protein [Methylocystis sp. L43]MBG0805651.1 CHASE3 domain-containing protein [Methylocystis sp. H15]